MWVLCLFDKLSFQHEEYSHAGIINHEGLAWLDTRCPPKQFYHSHASAGQGRENTIKASWVKIRTGKDHSPVTTVGETDSAWGN